MALIQCPECGKTVSDKTAACPNCGYPIREYAAEERSVEQEISNDIFCINGTNVNLKQLVERNQDESNRIINLRTRTGVSSAQAIEILESYADGDFQRVREICEEDNENIETAAGASFCR